MYYAKKKWKLKSVCDKEVTRLVEELNIPRLVAIMLINRGITETKEAQKFLTPQKQKFHDPLLFTDMKKAIDRINCAIKNAEKIIVFGDYDADGVTSTAILMQALRQKGAKNLAFYIPDRFTEGYGLNKVALEKLANKKTKLLITVDCGIVANDEIIYANSLGIDCIITDHHQFSNTLPQAFAILHPNIPEETYPDKNLSGAGVALKLARALLGKTSDELLALAAIGTIGDLVSLFGENRLIAYYGIKALKNAPSEGLNALMQSAGINPTDISEETIGFHLSPRINAAGRVASASIAIELLLETSLKKALNKAKELELLNIKRKELGQKISDEAFDLLSKTYNNDSVIVVSNNDWHQGVLGIVASKIVDKFAKPAIVLSIDSTTNIAKGSGRSIPGLNLVEKLSSKKSLFTHYGGHKMAVGLSLPKENIAKLKEALEDVKSENSTPETEIDAKVEVLEAKIDLIKKLDQMKPFGAKNPKPTFLIENVKLCGLKKMGAQKNHCLANISDGKNYLPMVAFSHSHLATEISEEDFVNVVGSLSINSWNNTTTAQFILSDISCNHLQIFDFRNKRITTALLNELPDIKKLILFDQKNLALIPEQFHKELILIKNLPDLTNICDKTETLVFLDCPMSLKNLEEICLNNSCSKLYLFFKRLSEKTLTTIPTREQFKWVYAYLTKQKLLLTNTKLLAKQNKWREDTIDFIIKVFFELNFVTINNAQVVLNSDAKKRDLSESTYFAKRTELVKLEEKVLLSSRENLTAYFRKLFS